MGGGGSKVNTDMGPGAIGPYCYPKQTDFKNYCTGTMGGVVDGGRCFFIGNMSAQTWSSAWKTCRTYSSTLAQVHTLSEYNTISDYLDDAFAGYTSMLYKIAFILVALRDSSVSKPPYAITLDSTYWYENETSPIAGLNVGNTFAKRFTGIDSATVNAPRCIGFTGKDDTCNTADWFPLCQYTNYVQNFAKTAYCMIENPIQEYPAMTTFQACADQCSQQSWCRSFNYIYIGVNSPSNYCQLFSRSIADGAINCTNCPKVKTSDCTCLHYDYVA